MKGASPLTKILALQRLQVPDVVLDSAMSVSSIVTDQAALSTCSCTMSECSCTC